MRVASGNRGSSLASSRSAQATLRPLILDHLLEPGDSAGATEHDPYTHPGAGQSPLLTASGRLAPMPTPGYSKPIDKVMFPLAERWAGSTAWGVNARAGAAGDDASRGDLREDPA